VLGPNDEITILAVDADELANKPIRVSTSGDINLPLVGRVHAAGLTVRQLETELTERLKVYIRQPDIAVSVTQFKSQPVSVIGSVGTPGVIQLEGRKSLFEVLSLAGGLLPDASSKITITRAKEWGPIPLPSVTTDAAASYSVAEVNYRSIIDASHPEQNIPILPYDVITVPRAKLVYAVGQVRKPGGFVLNDKDTLSILQLLALAEGIGSTAAAKDARIIRPVPGSERIEIAVNLKDILDGKAKDVVLQPEDMLFVPDSYAKGAFRRALDTAISVTTGMIIYR
jgi:polysaccharide export outer membrane protein